MYPSGGQCLYQDRALQGGAEGSPGAAGRVQTFSWVRDRQQICLQTMCAGVGPAAVGAELQEVVQVVDHQGGQGDRHLVPGTVCSGATAKTFPSSTQRTKEREYTGERKLATPGPAVGSDIP